MGGFQLTPGALDSMAGVLGGGGHHIDMAQLYSTRATSYLQEFPITATQGRWFSDLHRTHTTICTQIATHHVKLGELFTASAANLRSAETRYARLDAQTKDRLDTAYPHQPSISRHYKVRYNGSLDDPARHLADTPSDDNMPIDIVMFIVHATDLTSISGVVFTVMKLFGVDVMQLIADSVSGDSSEVARAVNGLRALAAADRDAAAAVAISTDHLVTQWRGRASDAARWFFNDLASGLQRRSEALDSLAGGYEAILMAMIESANMIGAFVQWFIDECIILRAELAAAGPLAGVPGINVILALVSAYQVWRTTTTAGKVLGIVGMVIAGTDTVAAIGLNLGTVFASFGFSVEASLPATPYVNGSLPSE